MRVLQVFPLPLHTSHSWPIRVDEPRHLPVSELWNAPMELLGRQLMADFKRLNDYSTGTMDTFGLSPALLEEV